MTNEISMAVQRLVTDVAYSDILFRQRLLLKTPALSPFQIDYILPLPHHVLFLVCKMSQVSCQHQIPARI